MTAASTYIVSVVNNFELYEHCIKENNFLANCRLKFYDNTKENIGIAERYNDFIETNITPDSDDCWVIFCHQDFGFEEDPDLKLATLSPDCIYGPVGINIRLCFSLWPPKIFRRKVTEGRFKQGRNNTDFEVIGNYLPAPKKVLACDCCCLIVHSSLIKRCNLRFDPQCKFHLYAEDFEISARRKYGIPVKAVQFACCHQGIGNYSDPQFFETLEYLKKKHGLRKLYSTNPYC